MGKAALPVRRDGRVTTGASEVLLHPIGSDAGEAEGVLVHAVDLTGQSLARERTARRSP